MWEAPQPQIKGGILDGLSNMSPRARARSKNDEEKPGNQTQGELDEKTQKMGGDKQAYHLGNMFQSEEY
jgi:hypothetical protein